MKSVVALILLLFCCSGPFLAQEKVFVSFIPEGYQYINASGPGILNSSGDIILQLENPEENDFSRLVLLRKEGDEIQKISENQSLLMNNDMLGTSGEGRVSLTEKQLIINYLSGSGSSQSLVSMVFDKQKDGLYYFKEYIYKSRSYGVENLFERIRISSNETGKISFATAEEEKILRYIKNKISPNSDDSSETNEIIEKIQTYIPDGYGVVCLVTGDLNLDSFKEDVLVLLVNYEDNSKTMLQILLQQDDKSYHLVSSNDALFTSNTDQDPNLGYLGGMNWQNIRMVIKNGFFTLEKRVFESEDKDDPAENVGSEEFPETFMHQYFTFKYDEKDKNWFSYRYAIEHFKGADIPDGKTVHFSQKQIGKIPFDQVRNFPK